MPSSKKRRKVGWVQGFQPPTAQERVEALGPFPFEHSSAKDRAVVLPPRSLVEHVIDRPALDEGAQPLRETLDLVVDRRGRRMVFEQRDVPVRPPGGSFGSISLSLRLAAANGEFVEVPPPPFGTGVILRRRGRGWQVFVEAMTVEDSTGDRIHLVFGPADASEARLEVGSDGEFKVTTGLGQDGLGVRVRRYGDRWRAEIDVPESWLANSIADSEAGAVLLGAMAALVVAALLFGRRILALLAS